MQTNVIAVKYEDKYNPKTFGGKSYNYYTAVDVNIGDLVIAPTSYGDKIARVSEINISEDNVFMIRPYMKLITCKLDKYQYLQNDQIIKKVA